MIVSWFCVFVVIFLGKDEFIDCKDCLFYLSIFFLCEVLVEVFGCVCYGLLIELMRFYV